MICLFKVEYTVISTGADWKANIIAESKESVEKFLINYLKTPIVIKAISDEIVVNGIADDIVDKIKEKYKNDIINEYLKTEKEIVLNNKTEIKKEIKSDKGVTSKSTRKKSLKKK